MKPKPRILIFSFAYHPHIGGAEVAVSEITDRLSEYEFDLITVRFSRATPPVESVGNVTVHRIGIPSGGRVIAEMPTLLLWVNKLWYPLGAHFKARSLFREGRYDILWSIMAAYAGIAAALTKIWQPRSRLVLTLQEGDEETHLKRFALGIDWLYRVTVRPLYTLVFRKADCITAISSYLRERARRIVPDTPVEVVPNGVSVESFAAEPDAAARRELRESLGFSEHDTVLVTTSRLVIKNGIGDLIAALSDLPENVVLTVIGSGPLQETLEEQATRLGVSDRVAFAGEVPHGEIPLYLHAADMFVRASLSEGMGNSFIEAMAAGLPVVATPVGGITDFVFDPNQNPDRNPTGVFCAPQDPPSIAEAVERVQSDEELRDQIVENARALVNERYRWDMVADMMKERVFEKVRTEDNV